MSGKGDTPRPLSVDQETYSDNWDRIFGPKNLDKMYSDYLSELHSGMFQEWYPGLTGNWKKDQVRWSLARMARQAKECEYSGLPSVTSYEQSTNITKS